MAEESMLTREQLEDATRCRKLGCSNCVIKAVYIDDCIADVAKTALALLDKVESQQQEYESRLDAMASAYRGEQLHNYKLEDAIKQKDKILLLTKEALEGACDYCNIPCSTCRAGEAITAIYKSLGESS
ncbi:hypothetical protein [Desulfitobacterium chlororespirans]|uniref:Uncharacterized protein n=1 Tax=Desulfitobacterium chlororespirans DSM 11544 TaxID=1121395 RepID=A0A1M7U3K1_9FIRM|nr:hypothetical protein [Desulfitobacterium chlororespirans]SHN77477.1 hypothetical protein SAMN02745215_02891 [Desulfitobacterium chlororespirans DSM 11544]